MGSVGRTTSVGRCVKIGPSFLVPSKHSAFLVPNVQTTFLRAARVHGNRAVYGGSRRPHRVCGSLPTTQLGSLMEALRQRRSDMRLQRQPSIF